MTELEKAARKALEALEYWSVRDKFNKATADAITALRRALEQQPADKGACATCGALHEDQVIKQPADEPVAWMLYNGQVFEIDRRDYHDGPEWTPVYTRPQPAAQWVGLTQQDIDIAFDDTQEGGGFNEFARAIDAKLREKNRGKA